MRGHLLPYDDIEAVFHQGACSDTMNHDGLYMMDNNYQYTLDLLDWCQDERIPFLYASSAAVYGKGEIFREERELEKPLNVYGYSKFLFDQVLRRRIKEGLTAQVVGFRYFNVYGQQEQHKGRMASVPSIISTNTVSMAMLTCLAPMMATATASKHATLSA